MDKKLKYAAVFCLIFIAILGVAQVFLFTSNGQDAPRDRGYWKDLAEDAWQYFKVGRGVNTQTGLHGAGLDWPYFTDWDLGLYIQAIIDAEQIGLLQKTGDWGADARLDKLLTFMETRELNNNSIPYSHYDSNNGGKAVDPATNTFTQANACDTGKLLVALMHLKAAKPELAGRIDHVINERVNFEPLRKAVDALLNSNNIYDYYVASGFAGFWPERFTSIADSIANRIATATTVETYGVKLPVAKLTSEVVLHCIFDLEPNPKISNVLNQLYAAHEARYDATGKNGAWSEGNTGLENPSYVYEWVVYLDGRTWVLKNSTEADVQVTPIAYFKVAVGFEAVYNTPFARSTANYIHSRLPNPENGFVDGVDENGRVVGTTIDKTNGLIMSAAKYAINIIDHPTPTSSPTPSSTSTLNPTATPNTSPAPTTTNMPNTNSSATPSTSQPPTAFPTAAAASLSPSVTVSPSTTAPPVDSEGEFPTLALVAVGCLVVFVPVAVILFRRNGPQKPIK